MKIQSSAFPTDKTPALCSETHQLVQKHIQTHGKPEVLIRDYTPSDLQQLKTLQKQWFPLNYGQDFYDRIINQRAICFIAQTQILKQSQPLKVVVGAIVFQLTSQQQDLDSGWFTRMFAFQENAVYIMTIGVIDQLRSSGLAGRLLDKLMGYVNTVPKVGLVVLHVVCYNTRAIKFYKRQQFQMLEYITGHYHIMGKEYDALKLGKFVNNGQRREKWLPWIKRVVLRMEPTDQWPV